MGGEVPTLNRKAGGGGESLWRGSAMCALAAGRCKYRDETAHRAAAARVAGWCVWLLIAYNKGRIFQGARAGRPPSDSVFGFGRPPPPQHRF
jgi:hypothetical protein